MSYNKAMNHWKNHHKDKYYQQCSGYSGKSLTEWQEEEAENNKIIGYCICDENNIVIHSSDTFEGIIEIGKRIKDKTKYRVYAKLKRGLELYGRLHLYY